MDHVDLKRFNDSEKEIRRVLSFLKKKKIYYKKENEYRIIQRLLILTTKLGLENIETLNKRLKDDPDIWHQTIDWLKRAKIYDETTNIFSPLIQSKKQNTTSVPNSPQEPYGYRAGTTPPSESTQVLQGFPIPSKEDFKTGKQVSRIDSQEGLSELMEFLEQQGIAINFQNEKRIIKRVELIANRFGFKKYSDFLALMKREPRTTEDLLHWLERTMIRKSDGSFDQLVQRDGHQVVSSPSDIRRQFTKQEHPSISKNTPRSNLVDNREINIEVPSSPDPPQLQFRSQTGLESVLEFLKHHSVSFEKNQTERVIKRLELLLNKLGFEDFTGLYNLLEEDQSTAADLIAWLERGKVYNEDEGTFSPLVHWDESAKEKAIRARQMAKAATSSRFASDFVSIIPEPSDSENLPQIFEYLNERKINYQVYKKSYVLRRLKVRMMRVSTPTFIAYNSYIQQHPNEVKNLVDSLSINFTRFFRDQDLFQLLADRVIPDLFKNKTQDVKIWSAGCAIGAEPYSLAMLIANYDSSLINKFQLLATDVSEDLLNRAKTGVYPGSLLRELTPMTINRYFHNLGEELWRVRDEIINMVSFLFHDLQTPPPQKDLDLILCRNVLIYFSRPQVNSLFHRFYEALKPDGYLVIGKSEVIPIVTRKLFKMVDTRTRIYQKSP